MPWQPLEKYIWDFWFARNGDTTHLFYLQADKIDCGYNPNMRHNIAAVGHAVMTPLGWKEVSGSPAMEDRPDADCWDSIAIWTGSIIYDDQRDRFMMFYTSRRRRDKPIWTPLEYQREQNIGAAVSADLYTWNRIEHCIDEPLIKNPGFDGPFDGVAWRDPYVIKYGDYYYCFITARLTRDDEKSISGWDDGGAVVYLRSKDLMDWSDSQPKILTASTHFYQMEVPQVVVRRLGDKKVFYLLFCAQTNNCSRLRGQEMGPEECATGTYYMRSKPLELDDFEIPQMEEPAHILGRNLYAGRIIDPDAEKMHFLGCHWNQERVEFASLQGLSDALYVHVTETGHLMLSDNSEYTGHAPIVADEKTVSTGL